MKVTIRIISVVLGFAAVATNPCFAQDLDDVEIKVHPVSGNVSYLEGSGGNIGLFVGEDGVFLIDDQYALLTERIVAAIRTVSNEPIRFLINTHMHPDHVGGNENFGKMGTLIFGHDNVRSQMAIAGYEQEPPLVTFSKDMSFVHTGDVYRTTSYPYIDTANGGSFLGTIRAYDILINMSDADTKIVPGHGVTSNVAEVRAFRDMLLVIKDRIRAAVDEGMTLEQIQRAGLTAEYDERWDSGRRIGGADAMIESAYADMAQ